MIEMSKEARIVHDAIALQKGDVEGHEFHGNQHTGGGGEGGSGGRESKAFDRQGKEVKVYIPGKGK